MLRRHHILRRRLAAPLVRVLIMLQCLATMPASAAAAQSAGPAPPAQAEPSKKADAAPPGPEPEPVTVNRTRPAVTSPDLRVQFDETPSSVDLARARVLPMPLRPVGGLPSLQENRDLGRAIEAFAASRSVRQLEEFAARYPQSPWRASLLVSLGKMKWQEGYFSRAAGLWDEAWQLTKDGAERAVRDIADIAVSEWLTHAMTFGQTDALQKKLDEIGQRPIGGPAGNKVTEAREGLWQLVNHHEMAVYSGPEALKALMAVTGTSTPRGITRIDAYHPPHMGTSLVSLRELATEAGVSLEMRFVHDATAIPVPSIVHLKSEHYSAVIAMRGDTFVLRDPALGGEMVMSRQALHDEGSGYVLAPVSSRPPAGRAVDSAEAERIIGRCHPGLPGEDCDCPKSGGGGGPGMPAYSLHPSMAAILVTDTPLTYTPPRGPAMPWTLRYNHRSTRLDPTPNSSHVGPLWSFDWQSYVQDNNAMLVAPFSWTDVVMRGESIEKYTTFGGNTHWRSRATLVKVADDPPRYERRLPDGTIEVFAFPDRSASLPNRKIFLTELIDPQGNTLTFTYDASFRLVALSDAVGQVTTVSYESPSDPLLITTITDPFGRTALLSYDSGGRLLSITDAVGMTSRFAYDESDFMTSMTTPYGTTTFRRGPDSLGAGQFRRVEATDPEGGTERLEYHLGPATGLTETVSSTDVPAGFAAWNQEMDQYNTLYWSKHAMSVAPGALSSAVITRWLYHPQMAYAMAWVWNIPHSVKRPHESRVWYRYPDQSPTNFNTAGTGRNPTMIARVLDDGSTQLTQITYNSLGMVTSTTDPVGRQMTYSYAANGLDLLEVRQASSTDLLVGLGSYTAGHLASTRTDMAGQVTTSSHNSGGQLLAMTNPKGETTTYTYESGPTPNLLSVAGPVSGTAITATYDAYGRARTITEPSGYAMTTEYDALNRVTKRSYPDSTYEQFTYQRLDLSEVRDRNGRVTRHFYDRLGRRTATRDPLGMVTRWEYTANGAVAQLTDASGNQTTWERDTAGRTVREVRGASETIYTYDATGQLKTVTDPMAQVTTYSYNADGTVSEVSYTNATVTTPGVSYTYDAAHRRLASMTDGTGTTTFAYKNAGQLGAGKIASIDGPLANDTITYAYDEVGRAVSHSVNGITVTSQFDTLGRLTTETNVLGTFTYAYDGTSQRAASIVYPNGQTTTFTYGSAAENHYLATLHHKYPGGATAQKFDYAYDPLGNVVQVSRQQDSDPAVLWTYSYDAANQLITAKEISTSGAPTALTRHMFGYDPAGNRTSKANGSEVVKVTYDSMNRQTASTPGGGVLFTGTVSEPALVTVQGTSAAVDASNAFRGNPTLPSGSSTVSVVAVDGSGNQSTRQYQLTVAGSGAVFTYDANGNMTADGTRTFEWDARNQLVAVNVGSHRSEFTYDGMQRRVRIVEQENGIVESDTRLVWCETVVCEERAADGMTVLRRAFALGEEVSGVSRFFMLDHLGSPVQLTDGTGAILVRYEYDPLGARTTVTGAGSTSVGFTGHQHHEPSGLALAMYRAYDPQVGRWISADPMGLRAGVNRYSYVANNPLKRVDPTGAASLSITGPTLTGASFSDQLTVYCGGRTGWGCTKTNVVIDCDCSFDDLECKWRATVEIRAKIEVFYLDHPKSKYSAATIIGEEFKHVRLIKEILSGIKDRGDNLELRRFDYKFTCLAACGIYRADSYLRLALQGPVVHIFDPHPE